MALPLIWGLAIPDTDLLAAPTTLGDPNVFDASSKTDLALSVEVTAGADPTNNVTVDVFFWDALASAFYPSGDQFILTPASSNLSVVNPNGLILGFTATPGGAVPPTSFNLDIGSR